MANWRPLTFKNRAQAQISTCESSEPTKVRKLFFVLTSLPVRRRGPNGFSALVEVVRTFMKFKICLYFWGVFGPWRGSVASYTSDERAKNGQKERWRWNVEELKLPINLRQKSLDDFVYNYCCPVKLFGCIRISSNHAGCSLYSILGAYLLCPIATIWPAVR